MPGNVVVRESKGPAGRGDREFIVVTPQEIIVGGRDAGRIVVHDLEQKADVVRIGAECQSTYSHGNAIGSGRVPIVRNFRNRV